MRKCMDIPSILFSFSEAALKRWSTATEAELKQAVSAQLNIYLEVHGGGRSMIEKWLIGKRIFSLKFTVMRELDYKEQLFWVLNYYRFLRILKSTTMDIILWEFLMFYQVFLSPQVKQGLIISNQLVYTSCLSSCRTT